MYLLNRCDAYIAMNMIEFTFHYVSIKSTRRWMHERNRHIFTFHYVSIKSTTSVITGGLTLTFTFHYVSIKSVLASNNVAVIAYLHSTMYLLNRVSTQTIYHIEKFTFHYVSIKS